jgi:hypothetical protein
VVGPAPASTGVSRYGQQPESRVGPLRPARKPAPGRRPAVFGPEPHPDLADLPAPSAGWDGPAWSYWDGWYCLVLLTDTAGDWDALAEQILTRRRLGGHRDSEAKLSHLDDLRVRLTAAGLTPADLAGRVAPSSLTPGQRTQLLTRARRKVLDQGLAGRDLTPAMVDTPRHRLYARALRGAYPAYPVDPSTDEASFADLLTARGWDRVTRLEQRLEDETARRAGSPAGLLALSRGLLTAGLTALDNGERDSGGQLTELLGRALVGLPALPWPAAGIPAEVFVPDLAGLVVWEDYGLLYRHDTAVWRALPTEHAPAALAALQALESELRPARLTYTADRALAAQAYLAAAHARTDLYQHLADRIGADQWQPIAELANAALSTGDPALATAVYTTAITRGGMHASHLAQLRDQTRRP